VDYLNIKELSGIRYLGMEVEWYKAHLAKLDDEKYRNMPDVVDKLKTRFIATLQRREAELEHLSKFIEDIPDDFTKQIFILRCVMGLRWAEVAERIGGGNGPGSMKKRAERYLARYSRVHPND
jgi:DNA-directed RNA polymerase specialized sigma24 family protein